MATRNQTVTTPNVWVQVSTSPSGSIAPANPSNPNRAEVYVRPNTTAPADTEQGTVLTGDKYFELDSGGALFARCPRPITYVITE